MGNQFKSEHFKKTTQKKISDKKYFPFLRRYKTKYLKNGT